MMTEEITKHPSGAVRSSDANHVSYHLVSPIAMRRLAMTCKEGEDKYSAFNWEKGFPINDLLNHGIAHVYKYLSGDRSEDHLAHAMWNLMAAIHSEEQWPHLNIGTLRDALGYPPEPTTYNLSNEIPQTVVKTYEWEAERRSEKKVEEVDQ